MEVMTQDDRNRWCGYVWEEQGIWIQKEKREGTAVDHFKDLCVAKYTHLWNHTSRGIGPMVLSEWAKRFDPI